VRASRLVNLLLLLQTRGQQTADELARELEVSSRTVYRDVEALSQSGVPIYAERGPTGGIRLVDGYRTRLTGLTNEEADSLFLSGLPGPAAELGLGTVVAAARLKVLAALPPELRTRASRISQRFHFDAPGWFRSGETTPHLEALARAVWENRRLDVTYRREGKPVSRVLDPLGLVLKAGTWYLVAISGGSTRTYRVSRVLAVTVLDERFERPERFDLATYWTDSIVAYERELPRVRITVRIAVGSFDAVAEHLSAQALQRAERLPDRDGGGELLRLTFEWDDEAELVVFNLGSLAEIVDPPELRDRMVARAQAILERYERPAPTALPA
jgi:predicted DNA-binding transcriptional regulator YafY